MSPDLRVIVYPPDAEGGRRVRVDEKILGRVFGPGDLLEFLRRAGRVESGNRRSLSAAVRAVTRRGGRPALLRRSAAGTGYRWITAHDSPCATLNSTHSFVPWANFFPPFHFQLTMEAFVMAAVSGAASFHPVSSDRYPFGV
ncbi:hypothetical protein [Streptomyces sp. NPDC086989]|uniref:hypothetical protein n=1 Tax=Streptomyces sp. NPDC086989 TaxID=3365764 RepID=UPI003817A5FD